MESRNLTASSASQKSSRRASQADKENQPNEAMISKLKGMTDRTLQFTVKPELHQQVNDLTAMNNDMISPSKILHAKVMKNNLFPYDGNKEEEITLKTLNQTAEQKTREKKEI